MILISVVCFSDLCHDLGNISKEQKEIGKMLDNNRGPESKEIDWKPHYHANNLLINRPGVAGAVL